MSLDEACAAGDGLDRCLLGTWRLDIDASFESLRATALAAGADTFELTGTVEVTFGDRLLDARLDYQAVTTDLLPEPLGLLRNEVTARGTSSAAYTADGLTLTVIDPVEDIQIDYVATADGRPLGAGPGPSSSSVADLFLVQSSYACPSADRLVITPRVPGAATSSFERVG
ncbi:MAG: hypothetical protein FJW86_00905 [Actinobacteria bacterium]|nr:hypothetical protein [Actinomycetota bacterium]